MKIVHYSHRRSKNWVVYWKSIGTGKRHHLGFESEDDAQTFFNQQSVIMVKERELLVRRKQKNELKKSKITVDSLLEQYFSTALSNKNTIKQGNYHVSHIKTMFGKRDVLQLEKDDVLRFIKFQKLRDLEQSTINERISILRRAINWGVKIGLLPKNPLDGIRLKRPRSRRFAPPTPSEAKAIFENAAPHLKRIIAIGINCGPRIGPSELFKLKWEQIDLENSIIRMPNADKGASQMVRDIPIKDSLMPLLQSWKDEDFAKGINFVITWNSKPIISANRSWKTALKKSGITRRIVPYSLRHAFATYSIQGGAKLKSVAKLMGHRDETMLLKTYQHSIDGQDREAIEALPDMLQLMPIKKRLRSTTSRRKKSRIEAQHTIFGPPVYCAHHVTLYARLLPPSPD